MAGWLDVKGEKHAASVVAEFLAAPKTIAENSGWVCDPHTDECRIKYLLEIDGIPTSASLDVTSFPMTSSNGFTITLNAPPCVARLDFDPPEKFHDNPIAAFLTLGSRIYGPHCHYWEDNAHLCDANSLPRELPYARPLPTTIATYRAALYWFCQNVNIIFHNGEFVERPPRGRLI